ncbi:zinc finger protein 1035 [Vanacampus margaritifer]
MAHEWDSYFQTVSPLSSDTKTLRSEQEGSLAQHIETFVRQHELSNSTASHAAQATDSTFDTNYYSTSSIGNSTSDCAYESLCSETPWQPDEELMLKDSSLRCEDTDVKDVAMNGLPSSYSAELQGLKQNCELLASSLLEDYSDVSSCSDTDVNETRPSCKFISSPTQQPKSDSTTKQSPSEWLFTHLENVTFSNDIKEICPGSPKLNVGENPAEETDETLVKHDTCNIVQNQSFEVILTSEEEPIEDCNDKVGVASQEQKNVEDDQIEGYYSDISVSDSENMNGMEVQTDHMTDHRTVTPECAKPSTATMKDDNGLEKETEETKESCPLQIEVIDNPNDNGEQKINLAIVEEACTGVHESQENKFDSLGDETLNAPTQTNIEFSSVHDHCMEINNLLSDMEIKCQDNEMKPETAQILDSPETASNNAICELECTNMLEANRQDLGSCLQLSKNEPSQNVVMDNIWSAAPVCNGHLSDVSDKQTLCSNLDSTLITSAPRADTDFVSDNLKNNINNPGVDIISDWPQQPCSITDSDICDKEEIMCCREENQTSCKDSDGTGVAVDVTILDVHVDNKNSISNDLKSSQKSNLSDECNSNKEKDSWENTPLCPQKSLQNPVPAEQEDVRVSVEGMDTCEEEKFMLDEQNGEPPVKKDSSDTDSMKLEEKCIVQSKGNRMDESEQQGSAMISSLQMRKRLQPVVIMDKMEPASSNSYECAVCHEITHSPDHLIEHHHYQHSHQIFQCCKTSNQYLMSNEKSDKNVVNKTKDTHLASECSNKKRKPHHCSICNLTISKIFEYVKHMRCHTNETPYKCDGCGSYFTQPGSLKRHKAKPSTCKKFQPGNPEAKSSDNEVKLGILETSPPQKVVISRTPLENLPQCYVNLFDVCRTNVCIYCGKQYSTPRQVKKHIYRMHKEGHPGVWQNDATLKIIKRRNRKPMEIHLEKTENIENEMRHKCALCPRLFKYSYNRSRHLRDCVRRVCSNEGKIGDKYRCPLCHATFSHSNNRYRHINTSCFRKTLKGLVQEVKSEKKSKLDIKREMSTKGQKEEDMDNKQTESNLTVPKTEQSYKCGVCPAVFQQVSDLYKHVKRHESKITGKMIKYKTPVLSSKSNLATLRTKTEETENVRKSDENVSVSLNCRYCEKNCDSQQSLTIHERCHKGGRPYRCLKCGRGFKKRVNLMSHKVVHQSVQCTLCRKILPNARNLVQHAKLQHKGKSFPCSNCQKLFLSPTELLRHLKVHQREENAPTLKETPESEQEPSKPNVLQCSLCKEVFDAALLLRRHSLTHISSCHCPYCNKKFKARRYLLIHMFRHTGEKPYSCTQCGKCFYQKPCLETHQEKCVETHKVTQEGVCIPTHTQEHSRLKVCSICSRTFTKTVHLKAHIKGHKLNTLRVCNNCGMYFGTNTFPPHKKKCGEMLQTNNIPSSNGEACQNIPKKSQTVTENPSKSSASRIFPIKCSICSRTFTKKGHLKVHNKCHKLNTLRVCNNCGMYFGSSKLALHKKICGEMLQTNNIPSSNGEACQNISKKSQTVTENPSKSSVSRIFPIKCSICSRTFTKKGHLKVHNKCHKLNTLRVCNNCGMYFGSSKLALHKRICGEMLQTNNIPSSNGEACQNISKKSQTVTEDPSMSSVSRIFPIKCSICSRTFKEKAHLEAHNKGHKLNTLRVCNNCGMYFGASRLAPHKRICGEMLQTNNIPSSNDEACQNIQKKSQTVTENPSKSNVSRMFPFKCPNCPKRFRFRSVFLRHTVLHTGLQPNACMHCGKQFPSNALQLSHEESCNISKEEESKIESSQELVSLPARMEEAQVTLEKAGNEYKCKFCTKTFVKPRSLRRHILSHNEVNPYRCKTCGSCFSRYDYLKVHHDHCTGERLRLQICIPKLSLDDVGKGWQKRFASEPMEQQERFDCKVCSKSFTAPSGLSRHVTLFHTVKLFKCSRCDARYSHEKSLKYHRKHSCKKVAKQTDTTQPQDNLPSENVNKPLSEEEPTRKLRFHSNKKLKYACSFCPRSFANNTRLRFHTRLHTGEKPFACDCGLRFIRNDYLKRHSLKCTVKLCKTCGVAFPQKELKDHQSTCTSKSGQSTKREEISESLTKGFSCAYCSLRFSLFSQLQEHFLNAHKLETVDPPVSTAPLQQHLSKLPINEDDRQDKQHIEGTNLTCKLDTAIVGDVSESFVCQVCNVSFENKAGLMGHSRVHSNEIPYKCKTCKKGFWNKSLLRNHSRKCRFGYVTARVTAQKLELPLKADRNLTLPDSVLMFTGEPQTDKDEFKEPPQNPVEHETQDSANNGKVVQYQCSECDLSFTDGLMLISHLEEHGREEQASKRFSCMKCHRGFPKETDLDKHMRAHGLGKKFACSLCSQSFYTSSDLEIHKTYHDSNRPFACKLCSHRFWSRQSLCYHYNDDHPDHSFSCRFCNKTYAVKKSLQRHYRKWHKKEQNNYESSHELEPVVASESGEDESSGNSDSDSAPYFPCHVCGKTFPTSENLVDHQKCHLGEKPHECAECGKCFFQASQLEQHKRMHKSELQCQVCGRGFVSHFALRKHKHSHGKSRPHRCTKCQLSFSGESQLAEHMSTHREENFPCDICNQVFPSKSSRAEHRKEHTVSSERPTPLPEKSSSLTESYPTNMNLRYRCGLCNERFKDPEELSAHGCKVSKERPYSCSDCDKHFLHSSHLKLHRATHRESTADSGYSCNRCNASHSSLEHFLGHLKTHENEVTSTENNADNGFRCPICSQWFTQATQLVSHFPVHSLSTLKCKQCKITFASENDLEKHKRRYHAPVSGFECKGCDKRFVGSEAFHQHSCSHKQQKMVTARKSGAGTKRQNAVDEEKIDVTGEELYNCNACSMPFSSKSILLEHLNKVHLNEKQFKCKQCSKSFPFRHLLQQHELKMHTKPAQPASQTKLKCRQCASEFDTAQDLSLHMRMHAERQVGQHRCDMCYKSFSHSAQLLRHQESHVGQIVYECTECDKAFAFPHLLEEHRQMHA